MKIAIVTAQGLGDAIILQIAAHQLAIHGHETALYSPHRLGSFFPTAKYTDDLEEFDAIFLQHDNSKQAKQIHAMAKTVYTFYGSYLYEKHGPLRKGFDYVSDLNLPMVDNVVIALKQLFAIPATSDNGLQAPKHLIHRKFKNRVAIHPTSGDPKRNWQPKKFLKVAKWLEKEGYHPVFLPQFPHLDELFSFLYESAYFLGNDSGPGHLASCMNIPHLIIGKDEKHMRHWRPGWRQGSVITPSPLFPRKLKKQFWKHLITTKSVIKSFKNNILPN
jgi:ADP-heptose:LPS heptosyltransferase